MSTIVLPKSALRKRSRCYWETRLNVKGQHAPTVTDNQRQNMKKKKKKKKRKKSPFVADFGCNWQIRYGSHLMIVMIFVTQNNF